MYLCNYGGASGSTITIGPTFSRGTNLFKNKLVWGTEIFSKKIGPGTKIFRTKIPVTVTEINWLPFNQLSSHSEKPVSHPHPWHTFPTSIVTTPSVPLRSAIMAFVLVKWLSDERTSIIPSAWVTKPTPIPDALPVDGECYWKKKFVTYLGHFW